MNGDQPKVPEPTLLRGKEAVALWGQGRDVWNAWINDNSDAKIDFSRVNFSTMTQPKDRRWFPGYQFGKGGVTFSGAAFGPGGVSFDRATFCNGSVLFVGAAFVNGGVSFKDAAFGDCDMSLDRVICARLNFSPRVIGSGNFSASGMKVDGPATFRLPPSAIALKQFDLRGSVFEGPLTLEGKLTTPPDLRSVKAAHHVELSGLAVNLRLGKWRWSWPPNLSRVAEDPEDAARLRRLKEIAENNRDHRAALRFSADENRARRWHETPWLASVLDMAFSGISSYGQSISRPAVGLLLLWGAVTMLYQSIACPALADWQQAARLSLSNSLPFLPQSRTLRIDASKALFGDTTSMLIDSAMVFQGTASFVLLFLIGLGLRNRFRL